MKAELHRKDELLRDARDKLIACEQHLKSVGVKLDAQLKTRLEMSTSGYMPADNGNGPSTMLHNNNSNNQLQNMDPSDNSVIVI